MIPEKHRKRLETVEERCIGYRKYIPVVGMCLLLVFAVVASTAVLTQPVDDTQTGVVSGQSIEPAYISTGYSPTASEIDTETGNTLTSYSVNTGDNVVHSVLSPDGDVFYTAGGEVEAWNTSTGNKKWSTSSLSSSGDISVSPDGSRIFETQSSGVVRRLNNTGGTVWAKTYNNPALDPQIEQRNGEIYVAGVNGGIIEVYPSNGTVKRTVISLSDTDVRGMYVTEDASTAYIGQNGGKTQRIDLDTGSITWTRTFTNTNRDIAYDKDNSRVLVTGDYNEVKALKASDGTSVWSSTIPDRGHSLGLSLSGDRIYVGDSSGNFEVIDTTGSSVSSYSLSNYIYDISTGYTYPAVSSPAFDPNLQIDTRSYLKHGNSSDYTVYYTDPSTGNTTEVTNDSGLSINSSNTTVFTLNTTSNRVVATSNTSINARENITATYSGLTQKKNVTVANATVDNLEILPGVTRLQATYTDSNIVLILIGTMLGVVATRASSAFAGIATIQLVLVAGFFVDLISLGVVLVGLFGALFIGLNLAANIDYTVRG